jgi:hypothetical protein
MEISGGHLDPTPFENDLGLAAKSDPITIGIENKKDNTPNSTF